MKASEKQDLAKKLAPQLERRFGSPPEMPERSVLDTLIYAVCLENDGYAGADASYASLNERFHDLNEIRVSSISELTDAFAGQSEPELRAHRVRSILQHVFEEQFEFDLEAVRKKTQEQAAKKLGKVRDLSAFVRLFVQQVALGAHLLPLDDRMTNAAAWLGLVDAGASPEAAAETLKSVVRKADAPAFCHYLRCLADSPQGREHFAPAVFEVEQHDPETATGRLEELLGGRKAKPAAKKAEPKAKAAPATKSEAKPAKADASLAKADAKPAKKSKATAEPAAEKQPSKDKPAAKTDGDKKPKGRSRAAS